MNLRKMKSLFITIFIMSITSKHFGQQMNDRMKPADEKPVSTHTTFYDNGAIKTHSTRSAFIRSGYFKEYFISGQLKTHQEYRYDKLYQCSSSWYENGEKKQEIKFQNGKYILFKYFQNNSIQLKAEVSEYLQFIGDYITYFENGDIEMQMKYDSTGKQTGYFASFFEKGQKAVEGRYEKGNFILINQWNANGKKVVENGIGSVEIIDSNNNLIKKEQFKNGLRDGVCFYYKNGKLSTSVNCKNGFADGEQITYYDNGRPREILTFQQGRLVSELRNLPKYDRPKLKKVVSTFLAVKRNKDNAIIHRQMPGIKNMEEVIFNLDIDPTVYKNYNNEVMLSEVFRVRINRQGKITSYVRSSGSIISSALLEKSIYSILFDLDSLADINEDIYIKYDFILDDNNN